MDLSVRLIKSVVGITTGDVVSVNVPASALLESELRSSSPQMFSFYTFWSQLSLTVNFKSYIKLQTVRSNEPSLEAIRFMLSPNLVHCQHTRHTATAHLLFQVSHIHLGQEANQESQPLGNTWTQLKRLAVCFL